MHNTLDRLADVATAHARAAEIHGPNFANFTPTGLDTADDADLPEVDGLDPNRESILGATFVIDYKGSKGDASRRRVTALRLEGDYLMARCHERKALRQFRLDRIGVVVDRNGVLYTADDFFRLILVQPGEVSGEALYMPGLQMLAAVAYADGWLAPEEEEKIIQYCITVLSRHDIMATQAMADKISRHVDNVFPTQAATRASIEKLRNMTPAERNLLFRYAIEVMDADEEQHPSEFDVIMAMKGEVGA